MAALAATVAAAEPTQTEPQVRLLNPQEVIKADDYPLEALKNEEQGTAHIKLTIDPDGRATACTIEKSSGSSILDDTTCRIYSERARYEPAAANAKPRVVHTRVAWRLSPSGLSRRGWFQRTTMALNADGSAASCRVETSDAPDTDCWVTQPLSAETAANYVRRAGYEPARLVIETRFFPEGEVPEEQRILQLVSRRSAKVVVKSDGKLRSCEVIEADASPGSREAVCREASQHDFEPLADAPDASGTIRTMIYLEPKSDR